MEEIHRKILRENRTYLVEEIHDVEGINDILMEKHILSNTMNQDILAERTEIKKVRKLLDTIPKRGKYAFDIFCNALIKTSQRHVAEKLNPELAHTGVTAVPAEPTSEPSESKDVKLNTSSTSSGDVKPNASKPLYPVPVQYNNNPKSSASAGSKQGTTDKSLPNPNYQSSSGRTLAGSQPSTPNEEYKPTFGRQESREVLPTLSEEELLQKFPKPQSDWPKRLDTALSSSEFKVEVCTAVEVKQQLKDTDAYQMTDTGKKRALIINNFTFENGKYEERKGADLDSLRIHQILKTIDFKIQLATNLKKQELLKLLTKEREKANERLSLFMVVILSYGGIGTVLCSDGEPFPIQDILDLFSDENCPLMTGVPKLFLFQACGAKMKDFDFLGADSDNSPQGITSGVGELTLGASKGGKTVSDTKGSLHTSDSEASLSDDLTLYNDMLVALATTADEAQNSYNSMFMLGLSYIISNYAKSHDFLTLLKGVNRLKKCDNSEESLKLCEVKTLLAKKLYLLPGYPHDIQGATGDSFFKPLGNTKPS